MSVRIPFRSLTDEQKKTIRRDLYVKERVFGQFGRGGGNGIHFYDIDPNTNDVLLPMYYAGQFLRQVVPNQTREFPRVPPFRMSATLREYQKEVVKRTLDGYSTWGTTFLNVFCSYGKTIVGTYLSSMFSMEGLATMVVFPRLTIGDSWRDTFRAFTDAKIHVVGEDKSPPDDDTQVFLCMVTRLKTLDDETRRKIGHLVMDEADCFCTSNYASGLLTTQPKFITCLTATYERDDGMHKMLDLMVGPDRIVRISTKTFYVLKVRTGSTVPNPKMGPRGVIFQDVVEKLCDDDDRNDLIVDLVRENRGEKILVMTQRIGHVVLLRDRIEEMLAPFGKTVSTYFGTSKRYDDADVTVGTIQKVGRGFDQKGGCDAWDGRRFNLAILATPTKKIEQPAGRALRADIPMIVDLVDDQTNCARQWGVRRKWYTSRNGQVLDANEPVTVRTEIQEHEA